MSSCEIRIAWTLSPPLAAWMIKKCKAYLVVLRILCSCNYCWWRRTERCELRGRKSRRFVDGEEIATEERNWWERERKRYAERAANWDGRKCSQKEGEGMEQNRMLLLLLLVPSLKSALLPSKTPTAPVSCLTGQNRPFSIPSQSIRLFPSFCSDPNLFSKLIFGLGKFSLPCTSYTQSFHSQDVERTFLVSKIFVEDKLVSFICCLMHPYVPDLWSFH